MILIMIIELRPEVVIPTKRIRNFVRSHEPFGWLQTRDESSGWFLTCARKIRHARLCDQPMTRPHRGIQSVHCSNCSATYLNG